MMHRIRTRTLVAVAALLLAAPVAPAAHAAAEDVHVGRSCRPERPTSWTYPPTGTARSSSTATATPRPHAPNPARNAPDDTTKSLLLKQGYALIGSSYATTGWAVTETVPDQLATLDTFTARFGRAGRTLAWGTSYGGLVTTALAERHASRLAGSLSMCGLVQGGVANWNSTLDPVFALRTLLAPGSGIPLTRLPNQTAATEASDAMTAVLAGAQRTADGRARIALAAALHNIPGWNDPSQPRPAPTDRDAQQTGQYQAVLGLVRFPAFVWRQEAESRQAAPCRGTPASTTAPCSTAPRTSRRSRSCTRRRACP